MGKTRKKKKGKRPGRAVLVRREEVLAVQELWAAARKADVFSVRLNEQAIVLTVSRWIWLVLLGAAIVGYIR